MKNLIVKPNSVEEHSIYIEAEIEVFCTVYQNQEVNLIEDLYSPSRGLSFTQKQMKVMQTKQITKSTCNIRDRILYEGELSLSFIYETNANKVDTKVLKVPFNFNMDFTGVNSNSTVETNIEISMQNFVVTSDNSVDVKVDLDFTVALAKNAEINIIDDIIEDENRKISTYSMIIYFVKPGDTLWKIAKKFGSTVEEIARVNGIEEVDKLNVAQQLFIPRYHG